MADPIHLPQPRSRRRSRPAFSLVEMLVALVISATLLTATMVALDVMFKRYTAISDAASTHVVARTVMHRMLAMIRTGREFGPAPVDVLAAPNPPVGEDRIEFVSRDDPDAGLREVTRLESRISQPVRLGDQAIALRGPNTLWLVTETTLDGTTTTRERPLLDGVVNIRFFLHFTRGPRLVRATIDLMVSPTGSEYSRWDADRESWVTSAFDAKQGQWVEQRMSAVVGEDSTIRLVASTGPRTGL